MIDLTIRATSHFHFDARSRGMLHSQKIYSTYDLKKESSAAFLCAELQYYKVISRRRYTTASLQRYSSSVGGGALHYVMYYILCVSHYMHEEKAARRGVAWRGVAWHRRCAKTVVKARTNVPRGVHKMHGEDRRKCERERKEEKEKERKD